MTFRTVALLIVLCSMSTVWAQSGGAQPAPGTPLQPGATGPAMLPRMRPHMPENRKSTSGQASFDERLQDMQETLVKMHALLKQMQSTATAGKDQMVTDNLHMWELLLDHLDRSLMRARVSKAEREAMYQRSTAGRNMGEDQVPAVPSPAMPK